MDNSYFENVDTYDKAKERVLWGDMDETEFFESGRVHLELILKDTLVYNSEIVLEIGTGVGRIARAFEKKYPEVIFHAIDKSMAMVDFASDDCRLNTYPDVYDGVNVPLPDGMIDLAFSFLVIQHIPKADGAALDLLKDIRRVLASGGRFIFNVPDRKHPLMLRDYSATSSNNYHMEYYSEGDIRYLARRIGFNVDKIWRFDPKEAVRGYSEGLADSHMMVELVKP